MNTAYRLGSVKAVSGNTLQVCSATKDAPPAAGQAVQLMRREQAGNPKFALLEGTGMLLEGIKRTGITPR